MKAILKTDQPAYNLKQGEIVDVHPVGLREMDLCPFSKQMIYRIKRMNQWLPEEDIEIINP